MISRLGLILGAALLLGGTASAVPYSTTGAGSSTIGSGGDYPSLAAACAAVTAAGTRDASAWTFEILNNLTESANSAILCTVNPAGSITFRPAAGVQATITWPNTIPANLGSSGHLSIGASITAPVTYLSTNNIIIDGSNTVGGTTRDLHIINQATDPEAGLGLIRVRGNSDNTVIRNLIGTSLHAGTSARVIEFTSDATHAGMTPDNWTVDNCLIVSQASTTGEAIRSSNSGTITSGLAQSGWTISNNTLLGGSRGLFLNQNAGGTIRGNTIRLVSSAGNLGFAIYHLVANSATGWTMTIDRNQIDHIPTANASAGDFGLNGIYLIGVSGAATYNVTNNMIGGWAFTGAASDATYQGIRVQGGNASLTVNIEHNSINMNNTASVMGATAGSTYAIGRVAAATPPVMNINNNIIRYLQTGTNAAAIYAAAAGSINANGNCIWASGTNVGLIGGTARANFAAWQGAGFDALGQNVNPAATTNGAWASTTASHLADLHFLAAPGGLAATGVATTIAQDIDGEARATGGSALPGADVVGPAATSYTWNVNGSGDASVAANWTPSRTTPRFNDVLVINGSTTAGPVTLNVRDSHLGGLSLVNNVTATLRAFGNQNRLVIVNGDNGAGADLSIAAGSQLRLSGTTQVTVDVNGAATGNVAGDLVFNATAASVPHRVLVKTAGALTFASGSTCAMAPASSGAGNGFGVATSDAAANSVVFQSGSTFYQGGEKDGTRNGGSGSNPFALTQPASIVVFNSGSTFVNWFALAPASVGRTYANLVWRGNGNASAGGNTAAWTITGNLSTLPSLDATQGNLTITQNTAAFTVGGNLVVGAGGGILNLAPAAAATYDVAGNVDIQDAALLTSNANLTLRLNGSGAQSMNLAGATLPNLTVNNASGVNLTGSAVVSGVLNLQSGEVATGANTLTVADGAPAVVRTTGFVNGTLTRNIAASTGARSFPVGTAGAYTPVDVNFTVASAGAGTLAVGCTATDHPGSNNAATSINRYWSLTGAGLSGYTADATFNYLDSDLGAANEADLLIGRSTGGNNWEIFTPTPLDTVGNTAKAVGVTAFSDWTLGEDSAVPVSLSTFTID